jgi:hypothetical protein
MVAKIIQGTVICCLSPPPILDGRTSHKKHLAKITSRLTFVRIGKNNKENPLRIIEENKRKQYPP